MCRENERTHKHHIIPRYMGGTNVAENLVEITVTQHAMYHFCNYQLWGNEEDKIAWLGLSNSINPIEASLLAHKVGVEKSRTTKAIEKKKKKLKEIEHQKGEKNSQYGKMWITNGTKEGTYKINKNDLIPNGFRKGRVCYNNEEHIERCFSKYIYTITTPKGKIEITKNLEKYCRCNGLRSRDMWNVAVGNQKTCKGYKVTRQPINTHKVP
jgi:hypothetical protein